MFKTNNFILEVTKVLKQATNQFKVIQTARNHSIDSSDLKEAVDYFENNPNLEPKVVIISYLIDKNAYARFTKFGAAKRWVWAVHEQVLIVK